jgi:ribosomal protein S18 acetylase RimI-like enzyme
MPLSRPLSRRPAEPADRDRLDALRRAAYRDLFDATWGGWDEERHARHFAACWDRGSIRLVFEDDAFVGMLQVVATDTEVEVAEVQVHPDHQGRGLGTRLLREVLDDARRTGRDVVLSTGLRNDGALRLYARLGFDEVRRTDTHVHLRLAARPD